jgi:uncharacterized paraquat-inducible protein A
MRPANRFYGSSPPAEPPEDLVMVNCTYCHKSAYSAEWIRNNGDCPRCQKAYAGQKNED